MTDRTADEKPRVRSEHWTAEQTADPAARADRWAIIYDPTPGGKKNSDGTTSYRLRFPALLISEWVDDPAGAAREIAAMLNDAEATRAALAQTEDGA